MTRLSRERLVRAGLVAVLLAGVLVAALGAGYRSSATLLGNASAYLQRDHDVVRVNAESEDVDAETARALATGEQRLEAVEVSASLVYVVNSETGEVWKVPTDSMQPELVDERPDARDQLDLVAGAGRAYLLDTDHGTLAMLEDPAGALRTEVALPDRAPVTELVVDGGGIGWALSVERGELYEIDGHTVVGRRPVAEPGEPARLTLAGDVPVVYLPARGVATRYGRQGRLGEVTLPKVREVVVAAPGAEESVLVTVVPRTAELVTADLATGRSARIALTGREGNRFGPPVVAHGRVYVPDYTDRHVVVARLHPLAERSYERVPGRVDFDVFARDSRVWVNDPYDSTLLSFDRDGRPSRIDKSTGDDVADDGPLPEPSPDAPPPAPPEPPPEESGEPVKVPDVVGRDRVEACAEVKEAGLECDLVAEEAAEGTSGAVLRTRPPAGRTVPAGSPVTIVFRALPSTVVPPNALTLEETCAAVAAAALTCRPEAAGQASSTADLHHVVSYEPAAGTEVESGTEVTVGFLEKPPTVAVPNVVTLDPATACQTLQAYFLQCVPNAAEVHWQVNVVHSQNVAAGTVVATDTSVEYVYSGAPEPVSLTRYRFVGPNGPQPAWHLSTGGAPGPKWINPHQFGGVYPPNETAVPGLIPVYQAICDVGCGVNTMYFYAREQRAPNRPPMVGNQQVWSMPAAPVFSCFANPVSPETRPLMKMYSEDKKAWTFAVQDSPEWQHHNSADGGRYRNEGVPICYVWYGVPAFPGGTAG